MPSSSKTSDAMPSVLSRLINNILDFTKIEEGKMKLKIQEVDIIKIMKNYIDVGRCSKGYAEKIMFVRQDQVAPYHYHARKTEDIINRGGKGRGRLVVRLYLYNSDGNGGFAQNPVPVLCDGIRREVEPGGAVILGPGESITLTPYLYHTFLRLRATV